MSPVTVALLLGLLAVGSPAAQGAVQESSNIVHFSNLWASAAALPVRFLCVRV